MAHWTIVDCSVSSRQIVDYNLSCCTRINPGEGAKCCTIQVNASKLLFVICHHRARHETSAQEVFLPTREDFYFLWKRRSEDQKESRFCIKHATSLTLKVVYPLKSLGYYLFWSVKLSCFFGERGQACWEHIWKSATETIKGGNLGGCNQGHDASYMPFSGLT